MLFSFTRNLELDFLKTSNKQIKSMKEKTTTVEEVVTVIQT